MPTHKHPAVLRQIAAGHAGSLGRDGGLYPQHLEARSRYYNFEQRINNGIRHYLVNAKTISSFRYVIIFKPFNAIEFYWPKENTFTTQNAERRFKVTIECFRIILVFLNPCGTKSSSKKIRLTSGRILRTAHNPDNREIKPFLVFWPELRVPVIKQPVISPPSHQTEPRAVRVNTTHACSYQPSLRERYQHARKHQP